MEQQYRTRLPGWEILEPPIGTGGFSTVYEIVRVDKFGMEEHAALKVISVPENKSDIEAFRDDGLDDKSITAYFKTQVDDISREFLLLSDMKGNSHIVSYEDHQIVQHDHDPGWDILIRMELLAPLTDYYRANFAGTDIDETTVIKIGVDLCQALELCERKKIIHRDIKPQNIFVNRNGDFKLGDFGIARVSDHTTRATKAGTYTYMAPEVYQNRGYNAKVDQYSLGLVLYWLLNERRMPFAPPDVPTAESNSIALQRRMSGEPLPAPLHGSPELKRIVLRACAFNPNERFSSPMELRLALELIAHGGLEHWRPGAVLGGGTFKKGETATLEVVPSEGCQFDAWSDGSTQTHRTIKVEENISLTAYFYGPLVDYTPEDEIPQNAVKVGDAKKQYQYQKKEYTTSSQSTLDGWTLYDSSYTWGDYGPFGEWTDLGNGVVVEEGQKIERRTVYRYYYFLCNSCGAHMHGYGTCYKWAGGCGGKTYASDYYVVWSEKSYSESGDWHGTGVNYVYTDEGLGFAYISTASKYYEQPKEQYRIASRQKLYTYSFYRYGTPYWSESQVSSDNVKLVSTRLLYRYRLR